MRSIAAGHRLAVGDDRERLERRRRQPDRVRADVARDQRAGLGRGRELDPVAVDSTSRMPRPRQRDLEVAEPGVDGFAVGAGERRDLAPRQRPLGDEQERLEGGLGQLDRLGRGAVREVRPRPGARRCRPASSTRISPSVMRTTPGVSSSGSSRSRGDARRGPLLGRRRRGRRSAPTARPARRRSRAASSARASPGT